MSGIAGIVNLDGAPIDRELLSLMTAAVGQTPLTPDDDVCLVADHGFNGEEGILQAYEKWGERCVEHLIGEFAFAIWDKRLGRLFCARDHFGVKPFFYAQVGNSFVFSNRLNVLRLDPRVSDELNETAVGDYLAFGSNQEPGTTIFRDIQRLPAAHTLTVSIPDDAISIRRYWEPVVKDEIRFRDPQSYVDRFTELLTTAVSDRLRGTERVSISMSGGLDSTSLAVIARDLLQPIGGVVKGYSNVYDKLIPDEERRYSTLAATGIGIAIHHNDADKYGLFEGEMNRPEPFLISPLGGQFDDLLRMMAENAPVALTGYDGDALMNETSSARPFRKKIRRIKEKLISKRDTSEVRESTALYPPWVEEGFARRIMLRDRVRECWQPKVVDKRRPATLRALRSKLWTPLLEGYDEGATRLPLEVRHPFLDVRLVEYILAIPPKPWCVNKHILRCAMKDRLPDAVINRPKTPLAGDPALQLSRGASVRWLDSFDASPQLTRFVNLRLRRPLAEEETPDALWANLRLFALNYWLAHSLPTDRRKVA